MVGTFTNSAPTVRDGGNRNYAPSYIIGTGSSTPKRILSNKDLESIVDTTDEWITRRTGIKERRISSKERMESITDLASQASLKALEMAGISPESLDMIVVGTVTPDRQFPSAACMVQEALQHNNLSHEDIELLVPHQANIRIILAMAKNIRIPMKKVYTNLMEKSRN